jgi:hypothetical protein
MRNSKRHQQLGNLRRTLRRWKRRMATYFQREGCLWLWFGSALAGVLAKSFFEAHQAGQPYHMSWPQAAMALVATLVTFQATFERYKDVRANTPLLVQVSLAFQCGFFWQTVFNDLTAGTGIA